MEPDDISDQRVVIKTAVSDDEIMTTLPVMKQLRPLLVEADYLERVRRQQQAFGYELAMLVHDREVKAAAGYKFNESLGWGLYMYVDDLIVDAGSRGLGLGKEMLDWLIAEARRRGCGQFHLDSGVMRYDAHRFYLKAQMNITCHHFGLEL